jgi:hypothetical protein
MSMAWIPRAAAAVLALLGVAGHAQGVAGGAVRIVGVPLGSGVPVAVGAPAISVADHIGGGDYHVPGYLPGHPTAAMLWPRVLQLPCKRDTPQGDLTCAGYGISPVRGEYLYLRPVVEEAPPAPKPEEPRPAPPVPKKPLG